MDELIVGNKGSHLEINTEERDELRECPFCGCDKIELTQHRKDGYTIKCRGCTIKKVQRVLKKSMEWLKENMIKDWNTRTPQFPNPCSVEQYKQITGEKFPDDGIVYNFTPVYIDPETDIEEGREPYTTISYYYWKPLKLKEASLRRPIYIVQTGKCCPDPNWKPEVKP